MEGRSNFRVLKKFLRLSYAYSEEMSQKNDHYRAEKKVRSHLQLLAFQRPSN